MYKKPFLEIGGEIMTRKGFSNPRNNRKKYLTSFQNNKSTTTNESSGINFSDVHFKTNFAKYSQFNTSCNKTTWYHTKTVSSLIKEREKMLESADEIMKERNKNKIGNNFYINNTKNRSQYIKKSQDICLKNFLISELKKKRIEVNNKEYYIEKAMKSHERQFDIDSKLFLGLMTYILII